MLRWYAKAVVLPGVALVAACASMAPLEPPKVTVTDVTIDYFTAADAKFTVNVSLANPNAREVAVQSLDAELRIEDIPIGTAKLAAPVRLPPKGEAAASIVAAADLVASLRAASVIAQRLGRDKAAKPTVPYAVKGTAVLEGGGTVPFSRTGEFKLGVTAPTR